MFRKYFDNEHELERFVRALPARIKVDSKWGKSPDQRYFVDVVDKLPMIWF